VDEECLLRGPEQVPASFEGLPVEKFCLGVSLSVGVVMKLKCNWQFLLVSWLVSNKWEELHTFSSHALHKSPSLSGTQNGSCDCCYRQLSSSA
jgi:hypothetical protein